MTEYALVNMVPCTIRPATDRDRESLWTVHVRAIQDTCSAVYSPDQIRAWSGLLSPSSYVEVLRTRVIGVAEDAVGVVGFGQLDSNTQEIEAVYVLPSRQGHGVGTALLLWLESSARAAAIERVWLSATLNAVSFYGLAGYDTEGPVVHRLPTGLGLQCVRMSKRLGHR